MRADLEAATTAPRWYAVADLAAGLAFPVAASRSLRPGEWDADAAAPVLAAAVGPAWLLSSVLPGAATLHQATLVLALLSFPRVRRRDPMRIGLAATALAVVVVPVSQLTLAALFAGTAIVVVVRPSDPAPTARTFPALAAGGLAVSLAVLWWDGRQPYGGTHTTVRFVAYAGVLVAVATGYAIAAREMDRTRERLADVLVAKTSLTGLDGLAEVLRATIGDASLTIRQVADPAAAAPPALHRRQLPVLDPTGIIAIVEHDAAVLDDPVTAAAVSDAVRLVVTNSRLNGAQQGRLRELEDARARLLAATDRERAKIAERLRGEVGVPLQRAIDGTRDALPDYFPGRTEPIMIAAGELAAAAREITDVATGVPPVELGDGRLADALRLLTARSPLPAHIAVDGAAECSSVVEVAMFYVCSEAITNAIKHSGASRLDCDVSRDGAQVVLRVSDDGRGGADPSGSGLQGLADRVASAGGRLRVDSPPGAGTVVVATLPAR